MPTELQQALVYLTSAEKTVSEAYRNLPEVSMDLSRALSLLKEAERLINIFIDSHVNVKILGCKHEEISFLADYISIEKKMAVVKVYVCLECGSFLDERKHHVNFKNLVSLRAKAKPL